MDVKGEKLKTRIEIKAFSNLSLDELYALLALRQQAFVVEQNCPYLDADGRDQGATHLLAWADSVDLGAQLAGCLRIFREMDSGEPGAQHDYKIGRVVVGPGFRGHALSKEMVRQAMDYAVTHLGASSIKISSQAHLEKLYGSLGYKTISDMYLEDNIPHVMMKWSAPPRGWP